MRDLPRKISIAEFATGLGCSVDTAKRWLNRSFGAQYVEVLHSPGGHWDVMLPKGDTTLFWCRIARCYDKFTDRKRVASKAMPKIRLPPPAWVKVPSSKVGQIPSFKVDRTQSIILDSIADLKGADALWIPGDLQGLIRQVAEETNRKPQDLLHLSEDDLMRSLSIFFLLRGAYALQKDGVKLTAKALAEHFGISLASLYRKPFGARILKVVLNKVENNSHDQVLDDRKMVAGEGLGHKRSRPKIPYSKRKPAFDRRRESKARHFLFWLPGEVNGGGRIASLYLVHESDIPEKLRPSYAAAAKNCPLPKYVGPEMKKILAWLETEVFDLATSNSPIATYTVSDDLQSYAWGCRFGGHRNGVTRTWQSAAKKILELVSKIKTRRKILILNPMRRGVYQVPECIPSLNPDDWD